MCLYLSYLTQNLRRHNFVLRLCDLYFIHFPTQILSASYDTAHKILTFQKSRFEGYCSNQSYNDSKQFKNSISFQEVFYLNHHKTTVHIDKTKKDFKCEICDYTSYAKRYIIAHKAKAHRERKHMCDQCGLKFIYPWDLRKHTVIIPLQTRFHLILVKRKTFS